MIGVPVGFANEEVEHGTVVPHAVAPVGRPFGYVGGHPVDFASTGPQATPYGSEGFIGHVKHGKVGPAALEQPIHKSRGAAANADDSCSSGELTSIQWPKRRVAGLRCS